MAQNSGFRAVVVGGGSIGRLHAQALVVAEGSSLVAFVGGEGARKGAEEFSVGYAPDLAAAMLRHRPDLAVICTPTGTHSQLGIEAAMLGLHVLVEKAMGTTVSAARALIRTCRDQGVRLGVVSQGQFEPEFEELLAAIEKSLERGLQWVTFEPNAEPLWARVRRTISNFLRVVWGNGALEGVTPEEAYFVKCDRSTMTQTDIDSGRLIVVIGVAPVKPAEFVIVRIGLWTAHAED